jgi:hypothetical protein
MSSLCHHVCVILTRDGSARAQWGDELFTRKFVDDVGLTRAEREALEAEPEISQELVTGRCSAVFLAAFGGHTEAVGVLIRAATDIDIEQRSADGLWPLYVAAEQGHVETVATLLQAKADPSMAGPNGWTALHAAALGGHPVVVRRLAQAGADLGARDSLHGLTACDMGAQQGHTDVRRPAPPHPPAPPPACCTGGATVRG